jgi:hypothetical protein
MSTHVGRVGSLGNDRLRRYNLLNEPYLMQDQRAYPAMTNTAIHPSTWANYKNVISGQYNRRDCWKCERARSFPQAPGVYNVRVGPPAAVPQINTDYIKYVNQRYADYQKTRMCNGPGWPAVLGSGCGLNFRCSDCKTGAVLSSCSSCSGGGCASSNPTGGTCCNDPPGYSNYHDKVRAELHPKQYVKGWWPDEIQDYTRTADGHVYGENLGVIDC